jgi:hypothetical protein
VQGEELSQWDIIEKLDGKAAGATVPGPMVPWTTLAGNRYRRF